MNRSVYLMSHLKDCEKSLKFHISFGSGITFPVLICLYPEVWVAWRVLWWCPCRSSAMRVVGRGCPQRSTADWLWPPARVPGSLDTPGLQEVLWKKQKEGQKCKQSEWINKLTTSWMVRIAKYIFPFIYKKVFVCLSTFKYPVHANRSSQKLKWAWEDGCQVVINY